MASPIPGPGTNPPPVPKMGPSGFQDPAWVRWFQTLRSRVVATVTGVTFTTASGFSGSSSTSSDGTVNITIQVGVSGILKGVGGNLVTAVAGVDYIQSVTLTGDATGTTGAGGLLPVVLAPSGVAAGTYGTGAMVPVLSIDAKGRVTGATTARTAATVGTTAARPASVVDGTLYLDTSLTPPKPIWKYAAASTGWIDATGTAV